jgi:hypothetical protein
MMSWIIMLSIPLRLRNIGWPCILVIESEVHLKLPSKAKSKAVPGALLGHFKWTSDSMTSIHGHPMFLSLKGMLNMYKIPFLIGYSGFQKLTIILWHTFYITWKKKKYIYIYIYVLIHLDKLHAKFLEYT